MKPYGHSLSTVTITKDLALFVDWLFYVNTFHCTFSTVELKNVSFSLLGLCSCAGEGPQASVFNTPPVNNAKWRTMPPKFFVFFCAILLFVFVSNVDCANETSVCDRYCIRKCCKAGQEFVNASCADSSNDLLHPLVMPIYSENNSLIQINISDDHFRIVFGDPCENGKFYLDPSEIPEDEYYLLEDGRLYTPKISRYHGISEYCIEAIGNTLFAFLCFTVAEEISETNTDFRWYPIGMIISMPFLLATALVYAILLELRTLHGKSLISYTSTLFIGYLSLAIVQIKDTSDDKLPTEYCVPFGKSIFFCRRLTE